VNPCLRSQLRDSLRADAARFTALADRHGTPLLVLQPHLAARRYRELAARLPGFRLHYAVKASPHPVVLSTIAMCGGGFDVATSAEVALLQRLGLPMDRCIDTNPIKKPVDIDIAYAAGIRTFVVENPCEVQKFVGRPGDIELLVRLAFRNPAAKSDLSSKFGVEPSDAELLVKHVIAAGVQFAGFSFHVGSQSSSPRPYDTALRGNETYAGFKTLSNTIYKNTNSPGNLHALDPFQSGELVVIATHYYAEPAIECALIKQMGDDANYWYGRPRAIAPDCI
jgi:ornithine decarboxylase